MWRTAVNWTAAILIAAVFLIAGLWKITDPINAAVRLAQAKVPESLSLMGALSLGIAETFAGVLLLVPRFRRWGASIAILLLLAFIGFIGFHYNELRGAECTCFPWLKRAVGPGFFIGDGIMIIVAVAAGGRLSRPSNGLRAASIILAAISVFAGISYGVSTLHQSGTKAPESITADDGAQIDLTHGKVFLYFFNPQCLHCLEAGRKLAALKWGDTRFIGIPTENPQYANFFMTKAGLAAHGRVGTDFAVLKKTFPFDLPPAGTALENGYEKARLLMFDGAEPGETLRKLEFVH